MQNVMVYVRYMKLSYLKGNTNNAACLFCVSYEMAQIPLQCHFRPATIPYKAALISLAKDNFLKTISHETNNIVEGP